MSHTPGPWHVGGKGNAIVYADVEGGSYAVCNAVTYHGQPNFEDAANARLISAAPDLLTAAEAVLEHCALVHRHWGENSNLQQANAAEQALRAAISKATAR